MSNNLSFRTTLPRTRPIATSAGAITLGAALVLVGILGPGARHEPAPSLSAPSLVLERAFEQRAIAEARARVHINVPRQLTDADELERRALTEARAIATIARAGGLTEADVFEQSALRETRAIATIARAGGLTEADVFEQSALTEARAIARIAGAGRLPSSPFRRP